MRATASRKTAHLTGMNAHLEMEAPPPNRVCCWMVVYRVNWRCYSGCHAFKIISGAGTAGLTGQENHAIANKKKATTTKVFYSAESFTSFSEQGTA